MRSTFCPKCGKKDIKGDLCASCTAANLPKKKLQEMQMDMCTHCRKYKRKNVWTGFKGLRMPIIKLVQDRLGKDHRDNYKISPQNLDELKEHYKAGRPGSKLTIKVVLCLDEMCESLPVTINFTACNQCCRRGTKYFEGILQLRQPTDTVKEFIKKHLKQSEEKGNMLTNEKKVIGGIDYYLTSNRFTNTLGILLQKKFGGILKTSAHTYSRNKLTSKTMYRLSVFFEPLPIDLDEVFLFEDRLLKLTRKGKQVVCFDFVRNKTVTLPSKKIMEAEKVKKLKTRVIKVYPTLEVMHPETYQPLELANGKRLKKLPKKGEKVKIVIHKDKAWFV